MGPDQLLSLQLTPDAADPVLAQQQDRFNALVREVAQWRAALAGWKERIARYDQAVEPARRELHVAWRDWVLALEQAALLPGLARAERQQVDALLHEAATDLLAVEDDAEIAALLRRHEASRSTAAEAQNPAPPRTADAVPASDDADAAEATGLRGQEEAPGWEQQAERAATLRAQRAAKRRAARVLAARRQASQEVSQSLRDVYRRLASVLHPDREPDAQQRARKTALMQQANQAYGEGHLLALLELQLQAEQLDAAHRPAAQGPRRVQHYVTLLEEQLASLQAETRRLEAQFRAATGIAAGSGLQPRKADRLISSEVQRLREMVLQLRRQATVLGSLDATRRWLRALRQG